MNISLQCEITALAFILIYVFNNLFREQSIVHDLSTVYPKVAKRSIPCAPLLSLNGSTVIIAVEELLA